METNTNEIFYIPEKIDEKTWDKWLDDWKTKSKWFQIKNHEYRPSLKHVSLENITPKMVERALKELKKEEIYHIPSIDQNINKLSKEKKEKYQKWQNSLTETQKKEYRKWYEKLWLDHLKRTKDYNEIYSVLEKESLTENINKACIDISPEALENLPLPNTKEELEKYQELLKYALKKLKPETIKTNQDILKNIPRKYINKSIIKIAIEKSPIYLNYLNPEDEEYMRFLDLAYKNKQNITPREKQLIKHLAQNNAELFNTLKLEILSPKIINTIGKSNLEKIVRYEELQNKIITIAEDENALKTFNFILKDQKENYVFQEIPIEKISTRVFKLQTEKNQNLLKIIAENLNQKNDKVSEYEKTIISYLILEKQEENITNYKDILTFVERKDKELEKIIKDKPKEEQVKRAYIELLTGLTYQQAQKLIKTYGNDAEELLKEYENKDNTPKKQEEKNTLELIINLKKLIKENKIDLTKKSSYQRYKNPINIENILKRAYGRELVNALKKEESEETWTLDYNNEKITIKKLNNNFTRLVTQFEAYGKHAETEENMYNKWNTNQMTKNHALCYSLINQSNPGTAKINKRKGVMISVKNIIPESLLASAPYDLCANTKKPVTTTKREQKFYTTKNMSNQTRDRYSEYDIEIQDGKTPQKYQKIQPASIICFEEIDEESLKAAQELQKMLNKTIPIELIDRRLLAKNEMKEIKKAQARFKKGKEINPNEIKEIITRFQNVRNAHISSDISKEIIGKDAPFNIENLNKILKDCLTDIKENKEKSIKPLEDIKQIIEEERQKPYLLEAKEEKEKWIGISKEIDEEIDEEINKIKQTYENQIENEIKLKIKLAKLASTKDKLKVFGIELENLNEITNKLNKKEKTTQK